MAQVAFKLSELDELLKNKDSGVTLVPKCVKKLVLSPFQLQDLKRCIKEYLYSTVAKYDSDVQDDGYNKLSYNADIYVFKPKIGSILTGIINKKSDDHLGCLVHKVFNIAIPRPDNKDESSWIGTQLKIGQEVQFKVVEVDLNEDMPYIKGELLNQFGFICNDIRNESYSNDEFEERICNSEEPNDKFLNNSNNNEKNKRISKQRSSLTKHNNSNISVKEEHFEKKNSPKKKEKNKSENYINVNNHLNISPNKYNKQNKLISNTLNDMYITMSKLKSEKNSKEDIFENISNASGSKSKNTENENHVKKLSDSKNNNDSEVFESKEKKKHKKKCNSLISSADVSLNNSKNDEETGFGDSFQNDILSTSINDSSATESNRTKKKKNHDSANENKIQKQNANENRSNDARDNLLLFQENYDNFKNGKKKQKIKNKYLERETDHKNHFKEIDSFSNVKHLKQKSKSCTDVEDFDENLSINNEKFISSKRNKNKHLKRNYYSLTDTEISINNDELIRKTKKKHKNERKENNFNDTVAAFSDCEHLGNKHPRRNYHSLTDIETFTNEDEFMKRKKKKKKQDRKQVDLDSTSFVLGKGSLTYSDGECLGIKKGSKESCHSLTDVEYYRNDDSDFKRKKKTKDKINMKSNSFDHLTDSLTDNEYVRSRKKKKSKQHEICNNDYNDMDKTKQKLLKMAIQQNKLNFNECIIKKPESNTNTVDKTLDIKFDKKKKKSKHRSKSFEDTFQLNYTNENETDNVKNKKNTQKSILDDTYFELKAEKRRKRRFSETNLEEFDNSSFSKKKKKKMKDNEDSFVDFDKLSNENQMETNLKMNNSASNYEINSHKKSKKKKKNSKCED
ncbi:uncharacterized protein LOC142328721 isoform X2 [Lycorma delicatula]|uniref:uncharacterized protein LOC142328721 isoform X2 n=1 Tax=Lycorma delicatula TaxID=130591 RepID=UPI003F516380